jgi:hypothetical protein
MLFRETIAVYCKNRMEHTEVEVEVNLRPTVSRSVRLGVRRLSGTCDQLFFLLEISFRQLRLYYAVAPSLTTERVCNLPYNCFWALPEQSHLGRSPAELTAIFYCLIWDSPNMEGQVPVFISPKNRVAQLYPRALGYSTQIHFQIIYIRIESVPHREHITSALQSQTG